MQASHRNGDLPVLPVLMYPTNLALSCRSCDLLTLIQTIDHNGFKPLLMQLQN